MEKWLVVLVVLVMHSVPGYLTIREPPDRVCAALVSPGRSPDRADAWLSGKRLRRCLPYVQFIVGAVYLISFWGSHQLYT